MVTYFMVVIHETRVISKIKKAYFVQIRKKRALMLNRINFDDKGFMKKHCKNEINLFTFVYINI